MMRLERASLLCTLLGLFVFHFFEGIHNIRASKGRIRSAHLV
jgi:hypothetical protein